MTEEAPPPDDLFPGGPADAYFPVVYQDLRRLAGRRLSKERENHSLRATELVHEVFLRLYKDPGLTVNDREHFLALSGLVMRRILVEHARRRKSLKRGGGFLRVTLDDDIVADDEGTVDLLALDQALTRLSERDADAADVVQHRFFSGLTEVEVAKVLGKSERWVREQWSFSRAWLRKEMSREN